MKITVDLSPEVLETLGFDTSMPVPEEAVINKLETLDQSAELFLNTEAGKVHMSFTPSKDFPGAYISLVPKGSVVNEIDLCGADFPKEDKGDINLMVWEDPFSEEYTHSSKLARSEVIKAMKSCGDYMEPSSKPDKSADIGR